MYTLFHSVIQVTEKLNSMSQLVTGCQSTRINPWGIPLLTVC